MASSNDTHEAQVASLEASAGFPPESKLDVNVP